MAFGRRVDGCGKFMKYSLFVVNVLILIGAVIVSSLGLWTVIDRAYPHELLGTNLYAGSAYVLVITGLLLCLISCFGCFGAIKEVRCMLLTYFLALLVIFVTMLVGGILGYVFREKVDTTIRNGMIGSMKFYGSSYQYRHITYAWNETQARLHCCGIDGYKDWQDKLPQACCKPILNRPQDCRKFVEQTEFTIYTRGCLEVVKEFTKDHAVIIGTSAIVVAFIMLLGMIFALALFRMLK